MKNKLAKLKYLPNNFTIIEAGDHVICAVSESESLLTQFFKHSNEKFNFFDTPIRIKFSKL